MTSFRDLITQKFEVEGMDDLSPDFVKDTIDGIESTMSEKVDAIAGIMNSWQQTEEVIGLEIKRLQGRKTVFANRRSRLKDYLAYQLGRLNDPRIETDLHTVSLRKGRMGVVIDDADELAAGYTRSVVSPDKTAIKQALEDGRDVSGAHLERGESFVVIK